MQQTGISSPDITAYPISPMSPPSYVTRKFLCCLLNLCVFVLCELQTLQWTWKFQFFSSVVDEGRLVDVVLLEIFACLVRLDFGL